MNTRRISLAPLGYARFFTFSLFTLGFLFCQMPHEACAQTVVKISAPDLNQPAKDQEFEVAMTDQELSSGEQENIALSQDVDQNSAHREPLEGLDDASADQNPVAPVDELAEVEPVSETEIIEAPVINSKLFLDLDSPQFLEISGKIGTVFLSNPIVANVRVLDQKIVLSGRSFGQTNLVVTNDRGREVARYEISVGQNVSSNVTLYKGKNRETLSCTPNCEPAFALGDSPEYASSVLARSAIRAGAVKEAVSDN